MTFEQLLINKATCEILAKEAITEPTDIQQRAIPLILKGQDVIAISKTGSGKTLTFALPTIELVKPGEGLQILVLAPTRELAVQIAGEYEKYSDLKVATVYGGVGMQPQIDAMARSEVLVATPGRTLDHLERGNMNLKTIRIAVLDEADKMVEMGFIEDIEKILSQTGKDRQMILLGATVSGEVKRLKQKYMHDPQTIESERHVKRELLKQCYYNVKPHEKFSLLVHLLHKHERQLTIIFCSSRILVETLTKNLKKQGFKAEMIHGKLSQLKRLQVMEKFNKGEPPLLVASAVAARGLHIEHVSHVINYDLSQDPEEYVHRVGRTARAGKSGEAITLLSQKDHDAFDQILRFHGMEVEMLQPDKFERIAYDQDANFGGRGDGRRRGPGNRGQGGPGRRGPPRGRGGYGGQRRGSPKGQGARSGQSRGEGGDGSDRPRRSPHRDSKGRGSRGRSRFPGRR